MNEIKAAWTDAVTEREEVNRLLAYEAAAEGIVMLENDGTLPVEPCKIALFGAGAEYTIKGGSGSGEVNVRHDVNVLEGLRKAGFKITTMDWIARYDSIWRTGKEAFIKANRKRLAQLSTKVLADLMAAEYRYPSGDRITDEEIRQSGTDTCIYIISRQSGEGHDRKDEAGSYRLDDTEIHNIRICAESYERFILIINAGGSIDLTPLDEIRGINAIIYMGQLGMEGGNALADVLTGKHTPSGKLAVTWPLSYSSVPFGNEFGPYAADQGHASYREGIYVGYRYYDTFGVPVRYPFGYGKSYTDFDIKCVNTEVADDEIVCNVRVKNTGSKYSGRETVQLYVGCPQTGTDKEAKRLAAFVKTALLAPGCEETLELKFRLADLASYDEDDAVTYLEQGDHLVMVGASSADIKPAAALRLSEKVVISKHRNLCASGRKITELERNRAAERICFAEGSGEIPDIPINSENIKPVSFKYDALEEEFPERVHDYVRNFSVQDMTKFCSGTGLFGQKGKGFSVPGAVGHTTADYIDIGIPNIELCDGPAGLRLQRRSTIDKKGKIKAVDASISLYEFLPEAITKRILGNPDKNQVIYQFVTGFPVAAMIAQTWDTDLAERIGRAVSAEMSEYGATYWLAPALNIVRNPLCGRNYEYYSEDPLVSGKMASAVTRGVQETSGNHVTIKHFAANNQEENRYYVSSDVDERALREIYLKGFEIVVRESAPASVMTAYNKINGVYCANNKELCTDILRSEWGFKGIIMTDWLSTGEGKADEGAAIEAGVDLIMPGGKKTVKALVKAYRKGTLTSHALTLSCKRVLNSILKSHR